MADATEAVDFTSYDHRDAESATCPWPRWERMRRDAPVVWSERSGGFFALSRYQDIFDAARDPVTFSSALKQANVPQKPLPPKPPIDYDPPEHPAYREIVNPFFSPAVVAEYKPWIREIADKYIQPALKSDGFDVPAGVMFHITHDITLRILGIEKPPAELRRWVEDVVIQTDNIVESGKKLFDFLSTEVEKRRDRPTDDIIGTLVKSQFNSERPLSHDEIVNMTLLLVLGGLETTVSATTGAVFHLLQHPEDQQRLAGADERLWRLALDEFVRWVSPLQGIGRTVRFDTEFRGCPMQAGDRVLMLWGSGNRDDTVFADADEVVMDRFPNRHLGFGMGPHRCIGSHLAKAMMQASLESFLVGLSDFRLEDPNGVVCTAAEARSWKQMRVVRK